MLLLVLFLALGTATAWKPACGSCTCFVGDTWNSTCTSLRTANCEQLNVVTVPDLPKETQFIRIHGGNISSLTGSEFDEYEKLTALYLQRNYLKVLPTNLFSKIKNLVDVSFDRNNLEIIQTNLFSNLKFLKKVWLGRNQISILENNCFNNVPELDMIDLNKNRIIKLNANFIDSYGSLKYVYFDDNPVLCDDSLCEFMNVMIHRKMWTWNGNEKSWAPTCASPASVQGKTWSQAVEYLWGLGPERCPKPRSRPGQDNSPASDKDIGFTVESNKIINELRNEIQELKDEVRVLVKLNEKLLKKRNKSQRPPSNILFETEHRSPGFPYTTPYPPQRQEPRNPLLAEGSIVPIGVRAELKCQVEDSYSGAPINLSWIRSDNTSLPSDTVVHNGNLYINNAQSSHTGVYICLGASNGTILFTARTHLRVIAPPRITITPRKKVVQPGDNTSIKCDADGNKPIDIRWTAIDRDLPHSVQVDGGYLKFYDIQVTDAGRYICTARNSDGEADAVVEVMVNDK